MWRYRKCYQWVGGSSESRYVFPSPQSETPLVVRLVSLRGAHRGASPLTLTPQCMTEVYMIALSEVGCCSRIDTRSRGDGGCRNSPAVVMQEPRRKSEKLKLVSAWLRNRRKERKNNEFTYQAEVDFNSCCEKNRPSFPGGVVRDDHTLPNIRRSNRTSDIDKNSQAENRHHSKSLSRG